jgi:hypothetical protein
MKNSRKRKKKKSFSARKFNIESVSGIEIAYTTTSAHDKLSDTHMQHIIKLSDMAAFQFEQEGRGGFLIVSEVSPNQTVYVASQILFDSISQLIPEALNKVQNIVNEYDPQKEFVVINVFNRKRIAITIETKRFHTE